MEYLEATRWEFCSDFFFLFVCFWLVFVQFWDFCASFVCGPAIPRSAGL